MFFFGRFLGELSESLASDLFAEERLLPLVHDSLVFLVHIEFVVHCLYTLLVKLAKVFTEKGHWPGRKKALPLKKRPEEKRGLL